MDAEIAVVTRWPAMGAIKHWIHDEEMEVRGRGYIGFKNLPDNPFEAESPAVTTSLDAALALAERVLIEPFGWTINKVVDDGAVLHSAALYASRAYPDYPAARTPAIALCIAILKAKAQGEGG